MIVSNYYTIATANFVFPIIFSTEHLCQKYLLSKL